MIKKYLIRSLTAFYLCLTPVLANPLVSLPAGDFSCEIEVAPSGVGLKKETSGQVKGLEVKKILITQIGKLRRDTMHWSDGRISEVWHLTDKGIALLENKKGDNTVLLFKGESRKAASPPLLSFDEASVAWISEKSLQKPETDAKDVTYYRSEVTVREADGDDPPETAIYQAWIDSKTLVPKKLDDGYSAYILNFLKPTETSLVLPANVKAELDLWIKVSAGYKHR